MYFEKEYYKTKIAQTVKRKQDVYPAPTEIVRRFIEKIYNRCDLTDLKELVTPDFCYNGARGILDLKEFKLEFTYFHTVWDSSFEDLHFTIDDLAERENYVAVRFTKHGRVPRSALLAQNTDLFYRKSNIAAFRMVEGKISEMWAHVV